MRALASAALIWGAMLVAGPALAQGDAATTPAGGPATTGSIGTTPGSDAPQRVGALSPTGRTKPPGAPLGDNLGTRPDLQEKSRQLDHRIATGICSGCR